MDGTEEAAATAVGPADADAHPPFDAVVVTPADQQYPDVVRGINQRYIGTPESVHIATSTRQVVDVVARAVRRGQRITVRSGGHCLEDFVFGPDVQVVLDLSTMADVAYDPARRAVGIGAGATLLRVYETLYKTWGVTIPGGICYSVGLGGHVSGGGWGMLCRRDGLVVDHLYAVEVVVVDAHGKARAVLATRDEHDPNHDLWWAHTGGGGGNFGVVTRYWFRSPGARGNDPRELLPRPPAEVLLSAVSWPWPQLSRDEFIRLAQNYAAWHVAHRDPDDPQRAVTSFLLLNHESNGQIGMVTQVDANLANAQELLDGYLAEISDGVVVEPGALTTQMADINPMPQFARPRRLPWLQATRVLGTTNGVLNDPTFRAEYKSAYMLDTFPDHHVATLYKSLTRKDINNPNVGVQLTPYGGAVNAVGPEATALPHRGAAFKMLWSVMWNDPAEDAKYIDFTRDSYAETYVDTGGVPVLNAVTDGCYVNYPDVDLNDPRFNKSSVPWHDLYYKENYPRLQQVKKRWDPRDVFRHSQSVELPDE